MLMAIQGCFSCLDDYEIQHMKELAYKVLNWIDKIEK